MGAQIHGAARESGSVQRVAESMLRILKGSLAAGASDVHLRACHAPIVRMEGELRPLDHPDLPPRFVELVVETLASYADLSRERLAQRQGDFACEVPDVGRFRVHFYRQNNTQAVVLRSIPSPVPDFATLRIPPTFKRLVTLDRGLVVVSGATGNGKSTTIASLLERVNQERHQHIVTIEDPVEFLFEEHRSAFSQRQVGRDVDDFESGLIGALREDPDWIFVGEVRTAREFDVALSAAEAGHVVLTTLHSQDTARAIHRMIHFYPETHRDAARQRLADALAAILSQRLVPRRGKRERVLVSELLFRAPTIQDCIRDPNRLRGLHQALESGTSEYGTHTFDQQLLAMVRDGIVAEDTARAAASHPNDFVRALKMSQRW
ncbi:MAG TPA: PilT/PilU family type 4a pilus ATPase [Sandaracinaceae bacterium LLY-WYZ-13_1]|nr:PilT/PilU family type 4a pilus ATPase [Sandaracinaceae bacterium LLY-WYZ-13_1]